MGGALRVATALAIVGTAVYAGVIHRSPWIVALIALSFTVLYMAGKASQWRSLVREGGTNAVAKALAVTLPVQAVLAGIFYLIGLGVGTALGGRSLATRLETFDLALAGGLLAFGLVASGIIYATEVRAGATGSGLSDEMQAIMLEAFELGEQDVAMPAQIFSLARRLTDHPDRNEALGAMDQFFKDDNAFVRRIAFTGLRFMGQSGRDMMPKALDRRIVEGMRDEAVWVRYDAAWCAGEIAGDDAAFAAALRQMIEDAVAAQANRADKNDASHKALSRARDSLKAVEARLTDLPDR
jgi:hypothetical protein